MMRHLFWLLSLSSLMAVLIPFSVQTHAAEIVRNYPMGEADDVEIGDEASFTVDTVEFEADGGGITVELLGFGTYVEGRNDDSPLAISFNGLDEYFQAPAFDPRNFGSFATLSQGWIKPDPEGLGLEQTVWAVGNDNGGVTITEDGFWQLNSGGPAGSTVSTTAVVFDEWNHLAVLRGGNGGTLYLNGGVIVTNDGFWNAPGEFYLGNSLSEETPFMGAIDDFAISGFGDGTFDPAIDIKFLDPDALSGILGDVDPSQDGIVDQADYLVWSQNVGFDNGLGVGDFSTLFRGDADQNGRVNFFDFEIIRNEAAAGGVAITVPEPSTIWLLLLSSLGILSIARSARNTRRKNITAPVVLGGIALVLLQGNLQSANAQGVILAEDFLYAQPTKTFGAGGGFTRQDYAGGQHSELGQWQGRWNSFGDGIIVGSDVSEEDFNVELDLHQGATRNGLSSNWLDRDFTLTGLVDEPLFFGITIRSNDEMGTPNATFSINDAGGAGQISMGLTEGGFQAILGLPDEGGASDVIPEATMGLDAHRLIGKLELNASGSDERLTVWLDPTDVETAENIVEVESNVIDGYDDFAGNLRLDHRASGGLIFWDDLAVGTTWESVATVDVPRVSLLVDTESREFRFKNDTGSDLDVVFLQAASERGMRDAAWNSLTDRGVPGFAENNPSANLVTESSFATSFTFADGSSETWGDLLRVRTTTDIIGHVGTSDGLLNITDVIYGEIPAELDIFSLCNAIASGSMDAAFDVNGDGVVDGADLTQFQETEGILPGDLNLDGEVNFTDFLGLSGSFGDTESPGWSAGDLDCNGAVEFGDFLILSANFGSTSMAAGLAASVPESNSSLLLVMGAITMIASLRSRRPAVTMSV